jgi:hypothetical protein
MTTPKYDGFFADCAKDAGRIAFIVECTQSARHELLQQPLCKVYTRSLEQLIDAIDRSETLAGMAVLQHAADGPRQELAVGRNPALEHMKAA